jgi:hypothetical protein
MSVRFISSGSPRCVELTSAQTPGIPGVISLCDEIVRSKVVGYGFASAGGSAADGGA